MSFLKRTLLIIALIIGIIIDLMIIPYTRAFLIMRGVTFYESKTYAQDITVSFAPKDWLGWFPQMILFTDKGGFQQQVGEEAQLDIYYTFGQFHRGKSDIYRPNSPYYSSFAGAYVVSGQEADRMNQLQGSDFIREVSQIPRYDYTQLILRDLGCPRDRLEFDYHLISSDDEAMCAGETGYDVFNLSVDTSGVAHEKEKNLQHYIQFGTPLPIDGNQAFQPLTQFARVYVKRLPDQHATLIFYCLSPDQGVIELTDQKLLQTAEVHQLHKSYSTDDK